VWLTLPFYDFCGFRSVAVNSVYILQFFTFIVVEIDVPLDTLGHFGVELKLGTWLLKRCPSQT